MLVATSDAVTPPVLLILKSPSTRDKDMLVPARILRRVVPVSNCSPVEPELLVNVSCFKLNSTSFSLSVLPLIWTVLSFNGQILDA